MVLSCRQTTSGTRYGRRRRCVGCYVRGLYAQAVTGNGMCHDDMSSMHGISICHVDMSLPYVMLSACLSADEVPHPTLEQQDGNACMRWSLAHLAQSWELKCITRENNHKYTRKKSQVCQTILVIAHFMRHHTCDRYLRFFRVYLRFAPYLRYLFDKHTCDLNRKYVSQNRKYGGPKGPNAHISQVCQGVADAKIASMSKTNRKYVKDKARINRKYAKDESQVCQGQITSMPRTNHKYVKDKSQVVKDKSQVCQQKISQVCYL